MLGTDDEALSMARDFSNGAAIWRGANPDLDGTNIMLLPVRRLASRPFPTVLGFAMAAANLFLLSIAFFPLNLSV
jgi:hypothetical protein